MTQPKTTLSVSFRYTTMPCSASALGSLEASAPMDAELYSEAHGGIHMTKTHTTYDMSIHRKPDADAWAKLFLEFNLDTGLNLDDMRDWFANAMMAMHDHLKSGGKINSDHAVYFLEQKRLQKAYKPLTTDFERGVIAAKQAIAAKVKDMACYFDKFETYSGKYGSSHGRENLSPDEIAELLTNVEVEQ